MKIEKNIKRKRKREKRKKEAKIIVVIASWRRAMKELGRSHFPLAPRPVVAHPVSLRDFPKRDREFYLIFYKTTKRTRSEKNKTHIITN